MLHEPTLIETLGFLDSLLSQSVRLDVLHHFFLLTLIRYAQQTGERL